MIEEQLFKLGVKTYTDTYYTNLQGISPTKIGQDMPNPVGWIYGISIETDSVNPTDQSLPNITLVQASQLWLYFKLGTNLFINNMRCDKLVYYNPASNLLSPPFPANTVQQCNYSNQQRYFPVNIPCTTDLKQSYYNNPTGIGSSSSIVQIPLTIWYININSYKDLLRKGYIFDGTIALPDKPKQAARK